MIETVWMRGGSIHRLLGRAAMMLVAALMAMAPRAAGSDDGLRREAERRGLLFVEAVNGDEGRRSEIVAEVFAGAVVERVGIDRLVSMFARLGTEYGPMTEPMTEVVTFGSGSSLRAVLHVYARDRDGHWRDFQIRQQVESPFALTELAFVAVVTEPIALPNGAITSSETIAWLRRYARELSGRHELSCSMLITGREGVILEMQTGFADAGRTTPITPETRFGIASVGKMLTALAIARLVEDGRVSFDDPLSEFMPGFGGDEFARACTIRHLLSHTSGVPEYWTSEFAAERPQMRRLEDYLPFITRREIRFAPGTAFEYSNSNYILLGLIIERVTGQDYFVHVTQRVLEPLGMVHTSFVRDPATTAVPLEGQPGAWNPVEPGARAPGVLHSSSAGGALSTPGDLARLAMEFWRPTLLRPDTVREMLASAVPPGGLTNDWGLGIERFVQGGVESFGHGGTAPGAQALVRVFPEEGIVVVIIANQNVPAFDDLSRNTIRLITGER